MGVLLILCGMVEGVGIEEEPNFLVEVRGLLRGVKEQS
jgi:hypothetical protein